ncbi:MAG: nucleotidyltransferase domain-containing protein [Syntrophobacteraceae bacterium]
MKRPPIDKEALTRLCRRYHIRRLSLFGSVLQGKEGPESDLDLLVEFEHGEAPGLLGMAAIEAEPSILFGGLRVDLRTARDLSPYFRGEVIRTAEALYAA